MDSEAQGDAGVLDPFFEEHPQIAAILDADARLLRINARFREALGFSWDDVAGKHLGDLLEPVSGAEVMAALARLSPGARVAQSATTNRKDGSHELLRWELQRARDGRSMFVSVAEQAPQVDTSMPLEQVLLQAMLDNAPVVLCAVDREGTFTLSEGLGLQKLGLAPGQVVGMNVFDLYGHTGEVADTIRGAIRGQPGLNTAETAGTYWDTRYIPLRGQSGEIEGAIGLSIDATERAIIENDLRAKLALIEEQELAIRSLSAPIIQIWDEVLALPILGTLDGPRVERILASLLDAVVEAHARYAILDLTGIPVIDTATANHLNRVIRALSLLGTTSVVTGIQPAVASTLVSLGVDLSHVITLGNLREAIRFVMRSTSSRRADA